MLQFAQSKSEYEEALTVHEAEHVIRFHADRDSVRGNARTGLQFTYHGQDVFARYFGLIQAAFDILKQRELAAEYSEWGERSNGHN